MEGFFFNYAFSANLVHQYVSHFALKKGQKWNLMEEHVPKASTYHFVSFQ